MDTTPTRPAEAGREATENTAAAVPIDAVAMVRRIRDDFAARTAGLSADELLALIRREAAAFEPAFDRPSTGRAAA